VYCINCGYNNHSSPAIHDGLVFIGSADRSFYATDIVTGQEKWTFKTEGLVDSSPSISEATLFGNMAGKLYALQWLKAHQYHSNKIYCKNPVKDKYC